MAQGDTNTSVDPLWFKDAIIYELHVKTFCDSDGDGMGDFRGLMGKLDYLHELGVTAIWLLPWPMKPECSRTTPSGLITTVPKAHGPGFGKLPPSL